ncbi:Cloroperoxidase [Setomelanomma holmii]|uniref:Cloroperoxidase n=1 Tax=Setomelanomma holmii TaxID=210430 RepID=A0A9P4LI36_9PLEO|nr:Cloroperoxidase [Setomelanomma holmii]
MSSPEGTPHADNVPVGKYVSAGLSDLRSPCPMINCLANHGYLPRNGQNITAHQMRSSMNHTGISAALATAFVNTVYNVHKDTDSSSNVGFFVRLWRIVRDPWTLLAGFGMRKPDQTNGAGQPILDLDQLALPGAVEHDISLTRRDHAQTEGNCARQEDLVNELLACSADKKTITREDLAALRRRRIATQREDNPGLKYGPLQHEMSCGEIALILGVLGDGKSAPVEFVEPFLKEERLPIQEGWVKRRWWTLGPVELKLIVNKVKGLIGLQIK